MAKSIELKCGWTDLIEKYIKIDKKKKTNDRPITVAFINHEGYTKIKFRDLINNDGTDYALSDESKYRILYENVFAEGYKKKKCKLNTVSITGHTLVLLCIHKSIV